MSEPREPTAAEAAEVTRALREARHEEPVPADVVARLEETLAGLRAEGASSSDAGGVPSLTARRRSTAERRHRVRTMLVAAAAVVVVGVGVDQVVNSGGSSGGQDAAGSAAEPEAAAADSSAPPRQAPTQVAGRVSADRFARDARALSAGGAQDRLGPRSGAQAPPQALGSGSSASESQDQSKAAEPGASSSTSSVACGPAAWGPGRLVLVHFQGDLAVLAYRKPTGDTMVVDLLECGSGQVLRTTTLDVR